MGPQKNRSENFIVSGSNDRGASRMKHSAILDPEDLPVALHGSGIVRVSSAVTASPGERP